MEEEEEETPNVNNKPNTSFTLGINMSPVPFQDALASEVGGGGVPYIMSHSHSALATV